ncbi:MAG: response regulator [Chromatiaceae bacterium]|jgi:two-component system chemotaxis response regulator CheY|nr:response regulator [Chromatiaceae bacterium]
MYHILTVDDSRTLREMLAMTLRAAGFKVSSAEDGAAALALAQTEHFALVITDINMPVLDGFGLIRALRELPDYRHTPILTLTTEDSPAHRQAGRAAGATGWMVKPFDPDRLLATLRRLLP